MTDSRKSARLLNVAIVLAVVVSFYALLESASYLAIHYREIFSIGVDAEKQKEVLGTALPSANSMPDVPYFTDEMEVVEENQSYLPHSLGFRSYKMWGNKAFSGKHLNVNSAGIRSNGVKVARKPNARNIVIWALGSSELFGIPANKDSQTLPAYLERTLSKNHPDINFTVINHSVIAYRTIQQSILLKFLLLNGKPDLVLLFDGANDIIQTAFRTDIEADSMTHAPLRSYWEQHLNNNVVNWGVLARVIQESVADIAFRYSRQAVSIAGRKLRAYFKEGGVEAWRKEYRKQSLAVREPLKASFKKGLDLFRLSVQEIIQLSKAHGAAVVLAQQPHIMTTKKALVGREITEVYNSFNTRYALPEERLASIMTVPPSIPKSYIPVDLMQETYAKQNDILAELARTHTTGYVNVDKIINDMNGKPVFWDAVHLTPSAHKFLASKFAVEVELALGLR